MKNKPVGAVMVVGGGISGMQSALDLAESGFKVYIVEKEFSIGGKMAALDKTFPTNDCAMCTISPRLVGVARHLNIEIITGAFLKKLEGIPGNFRATICQESRYIDIDKCTGCALCEAECPVLLPDEFNENLSERKAIFRRYPQAVPGAFSIDKKGMSPCRFHCPAGLSVQGYMSLTSQGRFREALEIIYRDIPFAGVIGRICPHVCEKNCSRNKVDEPLSIRGVKRFLADRFPDFSIPKNLSERPEKVALIGAGPSSLTAAYHLCKMGIKVTVFESSQMPGGMLRRGIPAFRLPRETLDDEINRVLNMGVELKTGIHVGKDITIKEMINNGFDAVYIATGLPDSKKLNIKGSDHPGIYRLLDFMDKIYSQKMKNTTETVLIIGGGNTATDAARICIRSGTKKAVIICLEPMNSMPAYRDEITSAINEGILIRNNLAPIEYVFEGETLKGLKVQKVKFEEPEKKGLPLLIPVEGRLMRPVLISGTEEIIYSESVITAIGQESDKSVFSGFNEEEKELLEKNHYLLYETGEKRIPVFTGGDMLRGPASAIEAMADGKLAAENMFRFFNKEDFIFETKPLAPVEAEISDDIAFRRRESIPMASIADSLKDFREIEKSYSEEQAISEASRCLECGICAECFRCESVCEAGAIKHDMAPLKTKTIEIGAVILAPGYEVYDPSSRGELGLGRWKNVITSIQLERILSSSGPFSGRIIRPGDLKNPSSVAFIQCVGSREDSREYCSSVCCMYAIKQAIIIKEHNCETDVEIFYVDIRTFGKGFEAYYERAKREGVKFTQCRISMLKELHKSGNISFQIREKDDSIREREFEMAILSCGLTPPKDTAILKDILSIELNKYNFCKSDKFTPLNTSRDGVFVSGAFLEPKDISDSVSDGSGAACKAGSLLCESRNTIVETRTYPEERELNHSCPRIGVFICHCGKNIGGVIDIPGLVKDTEKLKDVAYVEENLYTCSQDSLEKIKHSIITENLNRVVVSSCTPRTHESLFQEALKESGLNPFLFEMANIRDQCIWVHRDKPSEAYEKALSLIRMAVGKARLLSPLKKTKIPVIKKAIVIGAGLSGMTSAIEFDKQGFQTYLIEKEKEPGGNLKNIFFEEYGKEMTSFTEAIISEVKNSKKIELITEARLESFSGFKGNFHCIIDTPAGKKEIDAGTIIVATGGHELKPEEYLYGSDSRIMTQLELEREIKNHPDFIRRKKKIIFLQCVGSRNEKRPYCSRICCTGSIKRALLIKKLNPEASIFVLYRDIRTYAMREILYKEAREMGIQFIKFNDNDYPQLEIKEDSLSLRVNDATMNCPITINPDLVILSTAVIPDENASDLFRMLKIPVDNDGFFLEAHMKLRPVEFSSDGIYLCGLAQYPKFIEECIIQSYAAVSRALTILTKDTLEVGGHIAVVDGDKCAACLTCIRSCPYNVPKIIKSDEGTPVAFIEPASCQGCGICSGECPAKAIELSNYSDSQIIEMNRELLFDSACEVEK